MFGIYSIVFILGECYLGYILLCFCRRFVKERVGSRCFFGNIWGDFMCFGRGRLWSIWLIMKVCFLIRVMKR